MDNLTHTLTGIAISQSGLNRKTRFATLVLILGANAPDLDIISGFKGSLAYLKFHRGVAHSFLGITALAFIIWGLVYWLGTRTRPRPWLPLRGGWLLLAAFLGTGSHLLLDFTNAYGVRPFLPFSGRWYAWDIMPIIDPLLLAILIFGLVVPWLLRLISEEVGAGKVRPAPGAIFCLAGMVMLWGVRDFAHRRALSILDSHTYSGDVAQRLGAFPVAINPFTWMGVVETEASFHVVWVHALNADSLPEDIETFDKPQPSRALTAAMNTPGARIFLDFARFPWAQVEEGQDSSSVSLEDLRFLRPSTSSRSFILEVALDKDLRPISENFYFATPGR